MKKKKKDDETAAAAVIFLHSFFSHHNMNTLMLKIKSLASGQESENVVLGEVAPFRLAADRWCCNQGLCSEFWTKSIFF